MSKTGNLIDPLENHMGYQLRRASLMTLAALSEDFERLGLRLTDAVVMRFVAANPGCNQGQVSKALGIKRTNMVPVVAGLVDRGLMERRVADGRTHALALTDAGKALHERIVAAADAHEARFFGDFDAPTRTLLMDALRHVRKIAGQ